MNKIDLVVWDWDGTIADSTGIIAHALIKAARDAGLSELSELQARSVIGLGLRESIEVLFGNISSAKTMQLAQSYNHYYHAGEDTILLYDGIVDTLAMIDRRGCKQAIATGKGRHGLDTALRNASVAKFFNATKTVDECFSKPHPQMLDELMDELVVMPEYTVMIGDSTYDLQMGKNAGVTTVAVTYGSQTATQLEAYSPDYIFHDVSSLRQWLLEYV